MKRISTLLAAFALLTSAIVFAQADAAKAAPKGTGGVKAEFARNLDSAGDKLVQLAEAVPAEKYTWRPAEGVRSFSEAFLHAAGGNYFIPTFVGAKVPEGVDLKSLETSTTKKEEVIAQLKKSLDNAKAAANAVPDSDMDTSVKWFMGDGSKR